MRTDLLIGQIVNNWTVVEGPFKIDSKDHYKLKCNKCGKILEFSVRYIVGPNFSKQCRSCSLIERRDNLGRTYDIGTKISNLTVLGPGKLYKGNYFYKVQCDCGHIFYTGHSTLRRKLLGISLPYCNACFSFNKKKPKRNTMLSKYISKSQYGKLIQQARQRGIDFNLSPQDLDDLWVKLKGKCALSGVDLTLNVRGIDVDHSKGTASLDRIDSTKPYTLDNVLWVHKYINYMKCDFTQEEFIDFCIKVANLHANQQPSMGLTTREGSETNS